MLHRQMILAATLAVALGAPLAGGCKGMLYTTTGDMMGSFAVEHVMPHVMASDDVGMACETGVSMGNFLEAFGRVTDPEYRAALVTLLPAGMCAEGDAWEQDLRQLRAVRAGLADEAMDARITEKRAHAVAARRFYGAWQRMVLAYGEPGEACPELEPEDESFYLLGLASGLLAVVHDRASGGEAGVPLTIPPAVARATECLDSDRWWGAPLALKATLWSSVPGLAPAGADPWTMLVEASQKAGEAGVRLASSMRVLAEAASGREDGLRKAIEDHAASVAAHPSDPAWRLMDLYSGLMVRHESDRIWTREAGHRTPPGALGTFPEAPAPIIDDPLFDDLEAPADADGPSPEEETP